MGKGMQLMHRGFGKTISCAGKRFCCPGLCLGAWIGLNQPVFAQPEIWLPITLEDVLQLPQPEMVQPPLRARPITPVVAYRNAQDCRDEDAEGHHGLMDDPALWLKPQFVAGMLDETHCVMSWRANATARWIDGWFVYPHASEHAEASSLITVLSSVGWDQIQGQYVTHSLSSQVNLPALQQRLSLLVESNQQNINPVQVGVPAQLQQQSRANTTGAVALQLRSGFERWSGFALDAGVRGGPELFVRAQYFKDQAMGSWWMGHLHQAFVEGSKNRGESYTSISADRALGARTTLLVQSTWDWQENLAGMGLQWVDAISLAQALPYEIQLSEGLSVAGETRPQYRYLTWGPGVILHQPFWRRWLFYEIRPAYTRIHDVPVSSAPNGLVSTLNLIQNSVQIPVMQSRWSFSIEVGLGMQFGQ